MRRRTVALFALVLMAGLAGCSGVFGPPSTDADALAESASYEWDTEANATFTLERSAYSVVYRVENRTTFPMYDRDAFGQERSISISALQFTFPNGTRITPANSSLTAERGGGRTTIALPDNASGKLAFQASRHGKTFSVPAHVNGSYAVTLPPSARVGLPVLADVQPGGFRTVAEEDRVTVRWDTLETDQLRVRWYLERDLIIFSLLVTFLLIVGSGGTVFFYRQIKRLKARRDEVGLDVEQEDDDPRDRGPPPGMR
jgi:hypothetical protein